MVIRPSRRAACLNERCLPCNHYNNMNYLSVENIAKSYGEQLLFEDVTFGLSRGDKAALIARNGSGKTTLLRIMAGQESADRGDYKFRNGLRTAFLEQAPDLDGRLTIDEMIFSAGTPVLSVIRNYERAVQAHSEEETADSKHFLEQATNEMDRVQGWDYDRRLKQLLNLFRITHTSQRISNLSGGEKKRLALAMVLLDEPEMLILDEPTNHLDIDMIEWLERYLAQPNLTLLMVTHDRYFLDRVCNRMIELDRGSIWQYKGNYGSFLEKRAAREQQRQNETDKAGQLMKRELEWLRRMPKARTGKSKARIDAFEEIREKATPDADPGDLRLQVKIPRLGGKIREVSHISKHFGQLKIIDDFTYKFAKGERIGIIGRNGTGKTTFLNLISGTAAPDAGTMETGETIVTGYYQQTGLTWNAGQRVIDIVKEIAEVVELKDGRTISASQFLEHFLFPPKTQYKQVAKLSGGELRRLHLLTVLIGNPNFLILDEPTNDLDLFALNKLEEFLLAYEGCLLIVSHDRYFLDKLTDHLFVFKGDGKIQDHYSTYSAYKHQKDLERQEAQKSSGSVVTDGKETKRKSAGDRTKKKLTFKEKLEYARLEQEIEVLEQEKAALEEELNTGMADYAQLDQKSKKIAALITAIDERMQRWMDLGRYI